MRKPWQSSLAARLLILFLVLALVPLAAVSVLSYDWGQRRITRAVEAHLESVAILKQQEVELWVEHMEHTVSWVGDDPHTRELTPKLIASAPGEAAYQEAHNGLAAELRRLAALGDAAPFLLVDARDGRILVSSDPSWEGQYRDMETWFAQGQSGTWTSNLFYSQRLGQPTMVIATPIIGAGGEAVAVLAGHTNLDNLRAVMLERSGLGETGETYLVNAGNLLLTQSRFEPDAAFRKWVFTEGANRALAGEVGVDVYNDYRERSVIGAYRWMEDLDAALLVEVDQAEAFAPITTLRNSVIAVGMGVTLLVTLLGMWVSQALTEPLDTLVRGAEKIGAGNLEHRIEMGGAGEISQLSEAFNDMAERLRDSQRHMAETLALNQRIIGSTDLGITAYRASGECVLANEASAQMVGGSREDVLRQNFHRIRSWQTSGLLEAAREALRSGEIVRREVQTRSSFGRRIWMDCRFASFTLEGEPHLLVLTDDITERKQMEEQLVRRERLATLGQLSGSIAHELRNPMGAIRNATFFLDMAVDDPDPGVQEALEIVEEQVGRCDGIISALLDFVSSRPPQRRAVELNGVVREALEQVSVPPGVEVTTELDPAVPPISADPSQLHQVFTNLMRNAVQAMPDGGHLTVESSRVNEASDSAAGEVAVSIADTGVGIPEEDLGQLFEPLVTTKVTGIGLGLPIVRALVEGHGGRVELESEVGAGTTFTVRLPIGTGEQGVEEERSGGAREQGSQGKGERGSRGAQELG